MTNERGRGRAAGVRRATETRGGRGTAAGGGRGTRGSGGQKRAGNEERRETRGPNERRR